jgi:hypothetical protein
MIIIGVINSIIYLKKDKNNLFLLNLKQKKESLMKYFFRISTLIFLLIALLSACGSDGGTSKKGSSGAVVAPDAPVISGIANGVYKTNQSFTITGADDTLIEYSLNSGQTWNTYTSEVTLTAEDDYRVTARQTRKDKVSSFSPTVAITIDKTAPAPPVINGLSTGAFNTDKNFQISGESGAALEYSVNGGAIWLSYTGEVILSAEGTYTVSARQTDLAGNQSANASPYNVRIKKSVEPPVISGLASGSFNSAQSFTISGEDDAEIEYTLDGGSFWQTYIEEIFISGEDSYTISARQRDFLGNQSEESQMIVVHIDITLPDPPAVNGLSVGDFTEAQIFSISGEDNALIEYSVDGGNIWETYTEEVTLSDDGEYTVTARQSDPAGNLSAQSVPVSFRIDSTPPAEVALLTGVESIQTVVLSWTEPDNEDFAKVIITFTPEASEVPQPIELIKGTTEVIVTPLADGSSYNFTVKTVDTLGNISEGVSVTKTPDDYIKPVPGGGGVIGSSFETPRSFWITWQAGSDNVTSQNLLQYKIVRSDNPDISTVADAETKGIVVKNWTTDLTWSEGSTSWEISGLKYKTEYFYTVLVRDQVGNKEVYTMGSRTTALTPELPDVSGSGTIMDGLLTSVLIDEILYIGGEFSKINGPAKASVLNLASYASQDGVVSVKIPDGAVSAAIPDGSGGWFIGGTFTTVNRVARNRLARINADGSLHSWNPGANGEVKALLKVNNTIYAGGLFTQIGGEARNKIAAIDITTGRPASWNPGITTGTSVNSLAYYNGDIYIGGLFTHVQTKARNNIASVSVASAEATAWSPNANSVVNSIAFINSTLYAGGNFGTIGGQTRDKIAAIDQIGSATIWNPSANGAVTKIICDNDLIYAIGDFTTIGGSSRNKLAALNTVNNTATGWNPSPNNAVSSISIDSEYVYAGGSFTTIKGTARNYIAAIDKVTGNPADFNPNPDAAVSIVALSGNGIFTEGSYTSICSIGRNRLAAIDTMTGRVIDWNPGANDIVHEIKLINNLLYIGGAFTIIGGEPRNRLAALDKNTGLPTNWNPGADAAVKCVTYYDEKIFVGGDFLNIGGYARKGVAGINIDTGEIAAWNAFIEPNTPSIQYLYPKNERLMIGGMFSTVRSQTKNNIAEVDKYGDPTSWNPNITVGSIVTSVNVIIPGGSTVYVGGNYTKVGTATRYGVAEIDISTGIPTAWDPKFTEGTGFMGNVTPTIKSLCIDDDNENIIYIGGNYTKINSLPKNYLSAINRTTGAQTNWNPNPGGNSLFGAIPNFLIVKGNTVYTGGYFSTVGGKTRRYLAAIDKTTGLVW